MQIEYYYDENLRDKFFGVGIMLKRSIAAMLLVVMIFGCGSVCAETEETEQPYLVQITEDDPSIGYVLVQLQNTAGLLPLPQEGEYTKTIRQKMPDESEMVNVLHITPTGFWMEESNCEGQDCIGEGEVTLENRQERILGNMVICLPHQMVLYLITREEAEAIVR
jgi:hypothetical protein